MYLSYNVVTDEIVSRGLDPQDITDLVNGCKAIVAANADGARRSTLDRICMLVQDMSLMYGLELTIIGEPHLYLGFEFDAILPEVMCATCTMTGSLCLHV
jgi:hypothetical protein